MNKPQLNLQDTFLNQARKENIGVTIYLVNSIKLQGHVRGFDAFTILLDTPGKPPQLVYKHSVTSIVPMRPIQNIFAEASREAGVQAEPASSAASHAPAGSGPSVPAAPAPAVVETRS
ncbi:MAG: RNA chaperone Hfq [Capsulimonadaceae bacterium]